MRQRRQSSPNQTPMSTQSTYDDQVCVDPGQDLIDGADVRGSDLSDRSGQIREATEDMGQVDSMGDSFSRRAGSVLDALLPNEGDKGKVQININIPVDQSGTVRVGFEFSVEAERTDEGVKGRIQVGGGVSASIEKNLYFATFSAFAQAQVYGYMESQGGSSAAMFDLMVLGIQQRVAGASQRVADAVFDRDKIDQTIEAMSESDYVESGLGVSVSAGIGASAGDESVGAGAGVNASTGTRLTRGARGGLDETSVSQVTGSISGSISPFSTQGSLQGKWSNGQFQALEAKLEGEAMVGADQLNEMVVGGRWLSGAVGNVASIITGSAGMLDDDNAARQAGGLAAFMHRGSGVGVLAEAASARAISQLEGMGVNLGHKFTVAGTWDRDKGFGMELGLERVSQIEFGDNPRDLVYVLVENVQRVFNIKIGG